MLYHKERIYGWKQIKIVLELQNANKDTSNFISNESISDFKRGVIQGKIEELSIVLRALGDA